MPHFMIILILYINLLNLPWMRIVYFYTPQDDSGGVLWFHIECPCVRPSISQLYICILFPDDIFRKHRWIFTKHGMCVDIVKIWFGIANGQIS